MEDYKERVFKQVVGILFFTFFIFSQVDVLEAEDNFENLHAISAVLMDAESGRVLEGKNIEEIRPMASTTKIMTCILALECGDRRDVVKISEQAACQPAVHLNMKVGEEFYLEDLLYSLMLESHNDSAVAIAEHIGGSVEEFTRLMNEKALELGCRHTHFVTPNGLDAEDEEGKHGTTAEELAKIMSYCILKSPKSKEFLEITQREEWKVEELSGENIYVCKNHNALFRMMKGVLSGKTGYTGGAGYCYVGALENQGRYYVVAVLGSGWPSNKNYKWEDCTYLLNYGIQHYHIRGIPIMMERNNLPVEGGFQKNTKVSIACPDAEFKMLLKDEERIHKKIRYKRVLKAPVKKGEEVGSVTYYIGGEKVKEYPIITEESVEEKTFLKVMSNTLLWYIKEIK